MMHISAQQRQRYMAIAREWIESIVVAVILALIIRSFVIQAFKIPTGSMRPTLLEGDLILVNKFIFGAKIPFTKSARLPALGQMKRGDIVVLIYPEDRKKDFIKRLIGLPGETIEIKNGSVLIDGKALQDPVFGNIFYYNRGDFAREGMKITIPPGNYFMLGDNSASSKDSRYWGFVPKDNIVGKALVIYWPPRRMRIVH